MKQVCLQNYHMWVRWKMYVWGWVLMLVCKYVMPMCGTKHAMKVREFFCNVYEPIIQGCNHVKKVCKQIVSLWLWASTWRKSDGDLCIFFEHLPSSSIATYNGFRLCSVMWQSCSRWVWLLMLCIWTICLWFTLLLFNLIFNLLTSYFWFEHLPLKFLHSCSCKVFH